MYIFKILKHVIILLVLNIKYLIHFFTCMFLGSTIYVSEFNGSNQKSVHTVEDDIHSIAVDPLGG